MYRQFVTVLKQTKLEHTTYGKILTLYIACSTFNFHSCYCSLLISWKCKITFCWRNYGIFNCYKTHNLTYITKNVTTELSPKSSNRFVSFVLWLRFGFQNSNAALFSKPACTSGREFSLKTQIPNINILIPLKSHTEATVVLMKTEHYERWCKCQKTSKLCDLPVPRTNKYLNPNAFYKSKKNLCDEEATWGSVRAAQTTVTRSCSVN